MDSVNTDHKSPSESPQVSDKALIMPILLDDAIIPTDFVLCSGCGALTTTKYWDVHLGTHQDFQEVVDVLRDVTKTLYAPGTTADFYVSNEVRQIIQHWASK